MPIRWRSPNHINAFPLTIPAQSLASSSPTAAMRPKNKAGPNCGTGLLTKERARSRRYKVNATPLLIASNAFLANPWVVLTWPYQIEPPTVETLF